MGILIIVSTNHIIAGGFLLTFILVFVPMILLAFWLPHYTATAKVKISLDDEGIKKIWLQQFIFQNRPDITINWSDIQDYVFEPDRQFDKFKMILRDGTKFKFYHNNNYDSKDDFLNFLAAFEQKVKEINSDKDGSNDIKKGKTIYETTLGLVLAGFAVFVI